MKNGDWQDEPTCSLRSSTRVKGATDLSNQVLSVRCEQRSNHWQVSKQADQDIDIIRVKCQKSICRYQLEWSVHVIVRSYIFSRASPLAFAMLGKVSWELPGFTASK